jgi:GntR family transcriptional regulator
MSQSPLINLNESTPLYVQIREALRQRILNGEYFPSTRLPSESELERVYGVSRITVRQALRDLEEEGLLHKVHGKGTFTGRHKAAQNATQLRGFGEAMAEQGHRTLNQVLSFRQIPADGQVAAALQLPAGTQVCELKRLRLLDGEPISVDHTYLPVHIGEQLVKFDLETRDVFEIFETEMRIELSAARLEIEAIRGTRALARSLGTSPSDPILRVNRLTSTTAGVAIDYEHLFYRADRFKYQVNVSRRAPAHLEAAPAPGLRQD